VGMTRVAIWLIYWKRSCLVKVLNLVVKFQALVMPNTVTVVGSFKLAHHCKLVKIAFRNVHFQHTLLTSHIQIIDRTKAFQTLS
jgi:hypothetical protein